MTNDAIHNKIREEHTDPLTGEKFCYARRCHYCKKTPEDLAACLPAGTRGTNLSCHGLDVVNRNVKVLSINNLVRACCFCAVRYVQALHIDLCKHRCAAATRATWARA